MPVKKIELHKSILDIEDRIDLAVITAPAGHALAVVQACALKNVKAVILIPGGFGEIKKNLHIEAPILDVARKSDMRIMGSNCRVTGCCSEFFTVDSGLTTGGYRKSFLYI